MKFLHLKKSSWNTGTLHTEDEASIPWARAAESASDMAAAGADSPGLFDDSGVSSHEGTGRGFHFEKYLCVGGRCYMHTSAMQLQTETR